MAVDENLRGRRVERGVRLFDAYESTGIRLAVSGALEQRQEHPQRAQGAIRHATGKESPGMLHSVSDSAACPCSATHAPAPCARKTPPAARGRAAGRCRIRTGCRSVPRRATWARAWKVNPFVKVAAGETHTIMEVDGPGVIQHIWLVADPAKGRSHIIRFYWDGEETPSIETPVSDFFAVGHNKLAPVNSLAVIVNPKSAFNCYWPMPFRKSCRITFSKKLHSLLLPLKSMT